MKRRKNGILLGPEQTHAILEVKERLGLTYKALGEVWLAPLDYKGSGVFVSTCRKIHGKRPMGLEEGKRLYEILGSSPDIEFLLHLSSSATRNKWDALYGERATRLHTVYLRANAPEKKLIVETLERIIDTYTQNK